MRNFLQKSISAFIVTTGVLVCDTAGAQQLVSLNNDRLLSMEEPLAKRIGHTTFVMTGVLDSAYIYDAEDKDSVDNAEFFGNFQIDALSQLSNRWHLGLSYFGQYSATDVFESRSDSEYRDNASLSIGSSWGRILTGNVFGVVREQTRRLRGVGNAELEFDQFLGGIDDQSSAYVGRFGPWIVSSAVDGDGRFDLGATFQRPITNMDYRVTVRTNKGSYIDDVEREYDTKAVGIVAEVVYGSMLFDIGGGKERFHSRQLKTKRWFVSTGVRKKFGALSVSAEWHTGRVAGSTEKSTALGVQYDIARGLSGNLGINRAKVKAQLEKKGFIEAESTRTILSLRYSF